MAFQEEALVLRKVTRLFDDVLQKLETFEKELFLLNDFDQSMFLKSVQDARESIYDVRLAFVTEQKAHVKWILWFKRNRAHVEQTRLQEVRKFFKNANILK
jgi:hypothetical protein